MSDTKKRTSLYFNLDVPSDKELWDYLESVGRKSELIKRLIRNEMNGTPQIVPIQTTSNTEFEVDEIVDDPDAILAEELEGLNIL